MKDRYFKLTRQYSPVRESYIRYHNRYMVDISNAYLGGVSIGVDASRKGAEDNPMPENSTYESVRKITDADFNRIYNDIYVRLQNFDSDGFECYVMVNSSNFIEVYAYSPDKSPRRLCAHIDVRDFDDSICCTVSLMSRFTSRPKIRKNGQSIDSDMFSKIYTLALEYIYDAKSLTVLLEKFIQQYLKLTLGEETTLQPLNPVADFTAIIEQIKSRRDHLCRELIELDESREKRIKIRAEIAGLDYALNVIDMKKPTAPINQ